MAAKALDAAAVGLPRFDVPAVEEKAAPADPFALSSHQRARRALEFGLGIDEPGFNIFVLGESRSGRMTATLDYLNKHIAGKPAPADWVYVTNFKKPHRPRPYRLPAGRARVLRDRMRVLMTELKEALKRTLESAEYVGENRRLSDSIKGPISAEFEEVRRYAQGLGLDVQATSQGMMMMIAGQGGQPRSAEDLAPEEREELRKSMALVEERLQSFRHSAQAAEARLSDALRQSRRDFADRVATPLIDAVATDHPMLSRWFVEMKDDVLEAVEGVVADDPGGNPRDMNGPPEERYSINVMADHADDSHPEVVLEPLPTYANLFGSIEYKMINGALQTNFSMIRPGALHRANGGILVLRAEAIVDERDSWTLLKGALRDGEIRIDEPHRQGNVPMAQAPKPKPIPLDVKVVIVGAPHWYYNHFASDPDFPVHFKVKADIDSEMEATPENLATYVHLVRDASVRIGAECETDAIAYVLGQSARWAGHRQKVSGRFELIDDLLSEAAALMRQSGERCLTSEHIRAAIAERRRRNSLMEDRLHDSIRRGSILIDIAGGIVGQVNGLTVRDLGDHAFGLPSRITARTSVGKLGVVNIERATLMGGPIQQKGVMVLEGFLAGRFARSFPLSFSASITFEQNYGGVEGDSASLAELCTVLSDLADLPVRQDIAVTGSVNQFGQAQVVGGVHQKIEGFFRACQERGPLTGSQGVIVPAANEDNVTSRDEVQQAVADGLFHVWSVNHVSEAIELLTGVASGAEAKNGKYPTRSVYGRVLAKLAEYDRLLTERGAPGMSMTTAALRFRHRHLLGIQGLSREEITLLLDLSQVYVDQNRRADKKLATLRGRTVINLFFETSTRTRTSFELAGKRLGADVINMSVATSSIKKGETLIDTAMTLNAMRPDILVVRHPDSGAVNLLSQKVDCAVINGGDGSHEHPTQALLDALTIRRRRARLEGLTVAICGDILHSRVARSNIHLLTIMGATVRLIGPPTLMPSAIERLGVAVFHDMKRGLAGSDIVMMLRLQTERMQGSFVPSIREYFRFFGLDYEKLKAAKPDALIMHPGPMNRGVEIDSELADDIDRSLIREQVEMGVAVRMACLDLLARGEAGNEAGG